MPFSLRNSSFAESPDNRWSLRQPIAEPTGGVADRLRGWPLFNLGDGMGLATIAADSMVRVQVYSALALGAHGVDYYTWDHGVWNSSVNQSKGVPGPTYNTVVIVNADAQKWGNLLIASRHVGAIATMPSTCSSDAQCAPSCASGYPKDTVPRCIHGGCQCILLSSGASSLQWARPPGAGLPVTAMSSDLLVGVFSASDTGDTGYLMVVDTRAAMTMGALPRRAVSLTLVPSCTATVVSPGVERTLESMSAYVNGWPATTASSSSARGSSCLRSLREACGGDQSRHGGNASATASCEACAGAYQTVLQHAGCHAQEVQTWCTGGGVSLTLSAGEGALLSVSGAGCGGILRGVRRWQYDPRSISAQWLFGRNVFTNAKTSWTPWAEDLDGAVTSANWQPWVARAPSNRRADVATGGTKDRQLLIVGASYHERPEGIGSALSARVLAEAGFSAVSLPDDDNETKNETAFAWGLTWAATYGFSVFSNQQRNALSEVDARAAVSEAVHLWGCHTNFGGVLLDGHGQHIVARAAALRSEAAWGLPIVAGLDSIAEVLAVATEGVPLPALSAMPLALLAENSTAKTLAQGIFTRYAQLALNVVRNSSTPSTVAISVPVCATDSDSLLRLAAFASLPVAFASQRINGALWWEGVGECARIGTPKFELLENINLRITQAAWLDVFSHTGSGMTRVWSSASLHVDGSVSPGSLRGGLIQSMSPELVVFE